MKRLYRYNSKLNRGIDLSKCLAHTLIGIVFLSLVSKAQGALNQTRHPESVNDTLEDKGDHTRTKVIMMQVLLQKMILLTLTFAF